MFRYTFSLFSKLILRCLVTCLVTIVSFASYANDLDTNQNSKPLTDYKQAIDDSINLFEETKRERWSYKITRFENEEGNITSSIEEFNPQEEKHARWKLLALNGKQPTEKQHRKFIKKKLKKSDANQQGHSNSSFKLRKLIDTESLKLISQNDRTIDLSFNVYIKKLGDDAKGKLDGRLSFNKKLNYIESITITNNQEFSPMFSASISDFKLTLSFTKIDGAVLPLENTMEMKGSFAFFTEINETSYDRFSEYELKH